MEYNLDIELEERLDDMTEQRADDLIDALADFHGVVSRSLTGRAQVTITVLAETLRQAVATGLAVVADAGGRPCAVAAMPTEEYDRRAGLAPLPDLLTVPQAAELLGTTRQAVQQRIDAGTLPARQYGRQWLLTRGAVEAARAAAGRVVLPAHGV